MTQPELPTFYIPLGDKQLECTPRNTRLYTFSRLGRAALLDHVYTTLSVDGTISKGVYLFRTHTPHTNAYEQAREFMEANGYPMHLNELEASQGDLAAYERIVRGKAVLDHVPEGWL